jgi:hypothetical protein
MSVTVVIPSVVKRLEKRQRSHFLTFTVREIPNDVKYSINARWGWLRPKSRKGRGWWSSGFYQSSWRATPV